MIAAFLVFSLVVCVVVGAYAVWRALPAAVAEHKVEQRLREVRGVEIDAGPSIVAERPKGMMPGLDRMIAATPMTAGLSRLVEQAGATTTPGTVLLMSVVLAGMAAFVVNLFIRMPFVVPGAAVVGLSIPCLSLLWKRSARMAKFEEQFPDALDLMGRAIRAGHAFPSTLGMVADELPTPVGPEFRKAFDQQNFGLPLREALDALAGRMPLLDIKFFVTAVAIQRESGGNLAEILENLAHVVRERFKIRRQVRVHTAHGRFTGYVLLALPAFLALALSRVAPEQMEMLFREQLGQMMLAGAVVLQIIGFIWIRQVVKIEV